MLKFFRYFFSSQDFQTLKFILIFFVGWRIIISFIAYFGLTGATPDTNFWIKWANWDGGHFRGIAENGYLHPFQVVFFPLYPIFIKVLMFFGIPSLFAGLIISNLSAVAALFYLYKLVSLDFDLSTAKKSVFIALAFPTAFYFGAVYSESLFLLLTVSSFFYARKKQWFLSFLLASLSAVTRLLGVIVIISIAAEYFLKAPPFTKIKIDFSRLFTKPSLYFLLSFLPFLGYSYFLNLTQNNFFAFIIYEQHWQRQLTYPWSAPLNYFKTLTDAEFFRIGGTSQMLIEFLFFVLFFILLIISAIRLRISYTIYFALSLILPITTGTLQAIHRYGLVIFPIFILFALIKNETSYNLWIFFSLTLLGILTVLFINSYWVS